MQLFDNVKKAVFGSKFILFSRAKPCFLHKNLTKLLNIFAIK